MKNIFKKSLSVLLAVVMVLGIAPLNGFVGLELPEFSGLKKISDSVSDFFEGINIKAEATAVSGYYTYSYSGGTATINYVDPSTGGDIIIPGELGGYPVDGISKNAFENCDKISSITFAVSNTKYTYHICDNAFLNCTGLERVIFNETNLFSIGEHAFTNCNSLKSIILPKNVIDVGHYAFDKCTSLETVQIYNDELDLPGGIFRECSSLKAVNIPVKSEIIFGWAFEKCTSLEEITIPDSVKEIYQDAFADCTNLKTISIGSGVSDIMGGAFNGCTSLETISIPDNVTSIGSYAFAGCTMLKSIDLPRALKSISAYMFSGCVNLKDVSIPNGVTTIGKNSFCDCNSLDNMILPDGVTTIEEDAFSFCQKLTNITIPNSITNIQEGAFSGCYTLKDVYYKGTEEEWNSINLDIDENGILIDYSTIHFMGEDPGGEDDTESKYRLRDLNGNYLNYYYTFEDNYFEGSSSKYNHDLCVASLCLAMQAGTPDDFRNTKGYNAEDMLYYHNFDKRKSFGYESDPTFNSVACVVGLKNTVINGEDTTIVAVAVRGEGYRAEWGGNANVGTGLHHEGFEIGANKVLSYVASFLEDEGEDICENVIYWVTGYSRAAAIANLVASRLNNNASGYANISVTNPSKSKVFAYTFATPKNTTDKNASSLAYNNIFSIINPIDPVPVVAPESWGFTRYGVDYYLPAKEYTPGYNDKSNGIYYKMKSNYNSITGQDYAENFTFYQLGYDSEGDTLSFVPNKSMGQMTYINRLVEMLSEDSLKSRENYVKNFQGSASKLIAMALGGWKSDGAGSKKLIESMANILLDNWLYILFNIGHMTDDVRNSIAALIASTTAIDLDEAYSLTAHFDELITGVLKHPNYLYTTAKFAFQSSPDGMPLLFYPHINEIYLSWLTLVGQNGITETDVLTKAKSYRELKANCPIDINVYDSKGNLVASIVNNEPVYIEDNSLSCYVDENGQKCVALPEGEKYRVEMNATDTGEVNCTVHEIGDDGITVERIINYTEMSVKKGDKIICIAENTNTTEKCNYPVTNQNGEIVEADADISGSEIKEYTVTVNSSEERAAVLGGGNFKQGEFAQVSAVAGEDYEFCGWYVDGKCVSEERQYRFVVNKDVEISANYKMVTRVSIKTPSVTTVKYGDSIILHAEVTGVLPDGAKIVWEASNENFEVVEVAADGSTCTITPKSSGETTFTAKVVSSDGEVLAEDTQTMTSKAGLWDKIVAFFKKIFGLTKTIPQIYRGVF